MRTLADCVRSGQVDFAAAACAAVARRDLDFHVRGLPHLSPEELLRIYAHELYLGTIAGRSVRGVEEASAVYFGKAPQELTLAESATIAAMIRSPNVFSPVRSPARVIERRDQVLALMLRYGFIDDRELKRALDEPLRTPTAPDFT